jgi:hypothetical protein
VFSGHAGDAVGFFFAGLRDIDEPGGALGKTCRDGHRGHRVRGAVHVDLAAYQLRAAHMDALFAAAKVGSHGDQVLGDGFVGLGIIEVEALDEDVFADEGPGAEEEGGA